MQAKYTDLLLLNKHDLISEHQYDILQDALGELNDQTPRIRISESSPPKPEILFGLDTNLWDAEKEGDQKAFWDGVAGQGGWHGDEVETKSVWKGGEVPGKKRKREAGEHEHKHGEEGECGCQRGEADRVGAEDGHGRVEEVEPIERGDLEAILQKLSFEIYRGESESAILPSTSGSCLGFCAA